MLIVPQNGDKADMRLKRHKVATVATNLLHIEKLLGDNLKSNWILTHLPHS